jgi:hypothetical protein
MATPEEIMAATPKMRISLALAQAEEAKIEEEHEALRLEYNAFREANSAIFLKREEYSRKFKELKANLVKLRMEHIENVKAHDQLTGKTTAGTLAVK